MTTAVLKKKICFPEYANFQTRLGSFEKSLLNSIVNNSKWEFTEAGFFYTGKDDETICYYCGGGLKDWQEDDQPWEEHARWFPRCPFVLVNKGQDFVNTYCERINKCASVRKRCSTKDFVTDEPVQKQGLECIVCLSAEREIVFLPCKHCCSCTMCGLSVDNCVYCRTPITSVMKVFLV